MTKGRVIAAAIAAIFTTLALVGSAGAQYPTPKGNLVCTTTVDVSISKTTVTATLTDSAGKPVSGQPVAFKITSGTGSLSGNSVTTNAQGLASVWLYNAGNTSVSATFDGLECSAVAQILGSTFRPPSTGDAGLIGSGSTSEALILGADLLVMGLSGIGYLAMRRRRLGQQA